MTQAQRTHRLEISVQRNGAGRHIQVTKISLAGISISTVYGIFCEHNTIE